jgi:hypothetical protein
VTQHQLEHHRKDRRLLQFLGLVILLVVAFGTGACSRQPDPASQNAASNVSDRMSWRDAPEGSSFSINDYADGMLRTAFRCWPARGGYDCIRVSVMSPRDGGMVGDIYTVGRLFARTLPARDAFGEGPYICTWNSMMATESISSTEGTLVENHFVGPLENRPAWTRDFVRQYFRENNLSDFTTSYFDCRYLYQAVRDGSLATLGSTSIRRTGLF